MESKSKTDRNFPNNKPDVIIADSEQITCPLTDTVISKFQ